MILLDTDVVSALMRLPYEPVIAAWLGRQRIVNLHTSAPTIFELRHGIEATPPGRRRRALEIAFRDVIDTLLSQRIVPFDSAAAVAAGEARIMQAKKGLATSIPDSQIAGIALVHKIPIATGDFGDFAHLQISLINPWDGVG